MRITSRLLVAILATLALVLAACGDDDTETTATGSAADAEAAAAAETAEELPTVVVTTTILGDVVENLVGDEVEVFVVMPVGADPHDFQASAQQVDQMQSAEALIVNGGSFEEGLLDVIDAAIDAGVPTHEAIAPVATVEFGAGGHSDDEHGDEHADDEHGDEPGEDEHGDEHAEDEHDDEHGEDEHGDDEQAHAHEGDDPHFFADPARMAVAVDGIADFLIDTVEGVDAEALEANAAAYIAELESLDAEVEEMLAVIPEERRLLVTNHDTFGYFADRYDFELLGAIIPGGSTLASVSARDLSELASTIAELGVPAVFAETTVSSQLADTLAAEVGDVEVVELFTDSLGAPDSEGATYVAMVRTNAERMAAALGG